VIRRIGKNSSNTQIYTCILYMHKPYIIMYKIYIHMYTYVLKSFADIHTYIFHQQNLYLRRSQKKNIYDYYNINVIHCIVFTYILLQNQPWPNRNNQKKNKNKICKIYWKSIYKPNTKHTHTHKKPYFLSFFLIKKEEKKTTNYTNSHYKRYKGLLLFNSLW